METIKWWLITGAHARLRRRGSLVNTAWLEERIGQTERRLENIILGEKTDRQSMVMLYSSCTWRETTIHHHMATTNVSTDISWKSINLAARSICKRLCCPLQTIILVWEKHKPQNDRKRGRGYTGTVLHTHHTKVGTFWQFDRKVEGETQVKYGSHLATTQTLTVWLKVHELLQQHFAAGSLLLAALPRKDRMHQCFPLCAHFLPKTRIRVPRGHHCKPWRHSWFCQVASPSQIFRRVSCCCCCCCCSLQLC